MARHPWKPYDVEQAQKDVVKRGADALESARNAITAATEAAVEKLKLQARVFEGLPPDLTGMFERASHVEIVQFDPRNPYSQSHEIDVQGSFTINIPGSGTSFVNTDRVKLPSKKHRIIMFFLPVED